MARSASDLKRCLTLAMHAYILINIWLSALKLLKRNLENFTALFICDWLIVSMMVNGPNSIYLQKADQVLREILTIGWLETFIKVYNLHFTIGHRLYINYGFRE